MRLTTKSQYALLTLVYIARNKDADFVRIDDICQYYDIPKKYLQQLCNILRANRFITTKSGIHGGYKLAKDSREITIADVVRLMDGPLAPTESVSKYFFSHNKLEKEKKIIIILKDIRNYIADKLESITLNELV